MTTLTQKLANHPFFKGLPGARIELVAQYATEKKFEPEEYILKEGKDANEFYLILRGTVALGTYIPGHGLTTIQTLGNNEILGWSWLIPPYKWRFYAQALTPTTVIAIDGKSLRQECEQDNAFGYKLMKRLALVVGERLTSTRMRLEV